jgi:hypothetical protein
MTADIDPYRYRYLENEDATALEDIAYREIVIRHGEKVTLGQVLDTLVEIGWRPPASHPRSKPKAKPVVKLEECDSCRKTVDPASAAALCRLGFQCPYKAVRR